MREIRMPSLGADMDAGTLVEWNVAVGDHVARGAVVGLIETQKATMELESFAEGIVDALLVEPGSKVPVGTVLARLRDGSAAEIEKALPTPITPPVPSAPPVPLVVPAPVPPVPSAAPVAQPARVRGSPAARQRARELGLDLASLHGTGPHGAIVLRDVHAPPVAAKPRPTPSFAGPMRDAIASAMARSKREIPHFYLSHTISLKRSLTWLAEKNHDRTIHDRVLPGALLLRAVALALWEYPELNGFFVEGAFRPSEEVHLATAISLRTGGLIAPAILDADTKSLDELMQDLGDLVIRARSGHLKTSELTSATFTVTSLGDRGCEAVFPVINPPQVAIVGFGSISERPWVEGAAVVPHPTVVAVLAADHRVSDGHRGGLFLSTLDRLLQDPTRL
jgi:pyruvate dehydrogenase E2 component (dihydrolipoamide acetyltransferase)